LSDANIFCLFAAFADKRTRILYNDLTGTFPFISLEGNVCFLIVYHYKTNAILALPIAGFSDDIMFAAYQQQYNLLKLKGYKIRLNIMDNQATKVIKKFLDEQQCNLLLVEPHTTMSMLQSVPFKHSRHISSAPWPQPTVNFHCNCGTNSCPKSRAH
jgi:hypothetical protein